MLNLGLLRGTRAFFLVEVLNSRKFHLRPYTHPFFLRADTFDRNVFREIFLLNDYAIPLPSEPHVIVDAGANVGLSTVYFRHRYPSAVIYAIEPDQKNYAAMLQNIQHYNQVVPIESALWHRDVSLRVKNPGGHSWALEVEECSADVPNSFKAISLETLMKRNALSHIDLLKLDVEGSERELFSAGYEYWLPKTRTIIVETHDWLKDGCSREVFKAISKYSFKLTIHGGMLVFTNNEG